MFVTHLITECDISVTQNKAGIPIEKWLLSPTDLTKNDRFFTGLELFACSFDSECINGLRIQ